MNTETLRSIIRYYSRNASHIVNVTKHQRGDLTPYIKVKHKVDWSEGVVITDEEGNYEKAYSKETFYMTFHKVKCKDGCGNKGLIVVPSITQPTRCYAFQHSYPYYNIPICFYNLLIHSIGYGTHEAPSRSIVHLSNYHKHMEGGITYNNKVMRDFRIEFKHGFEMSEEGRKIINLYNYRQNSNIYYLQQVIHLIEEVQRWSGKYFISVEDA